MQFGISFFDQPLVLVRHSLFNKTSTKDAFNNNNLLQFCLETLGISVSKMKDMQIKVDELSMNKFPFCIVYIHGRLLGGKGGFGSQLRAQGGRMSKKKSNNIESCRNLQGKRLRVVNQEAKMAEFMSRADELKRRKEEKLEKKMELVLNPEPKKKYFTDTSYIEQSRNIQENIEQALQIKDRSTLQKRQKETICYNDDPTLTELLSSSSEQEDLISKQ